MNRKCRKFASHLSAYIDGELSPPIKAAVEKHLATCSDCAEKLSRWTMLSERSAAGLKALAHSSSPPPGIAARVMAEARARRAHLRTVGALRRLAIGAAVALVAVVVGGAVLFSAMGHEKQTLRRLVAHLRSELQIAQRDVAIFHAEKQLREVQDRQEREQKAITALYLRMGELERRLDQGYSPRTAFLPTEGSSL